MRDEDLPLRTLIREMIRSGERLYAVVDAARDSYLALSAFTRFGIVTYTLFEGEMAPLLDHVAPHLVPIHIDSNYMELWAERLGNSIGILLLTEEDPEELHKHLRKIFEAIDEDGDEYFFRYFDPRVLRVYLPTCTGEEADLFFGPIRVILAEAEQPGALLCYQHDETGVMSETLPCGPGTTSRGKEGAEQ